MTTAPELPRPGSSPRTRVRRLPEKAAEDRASLLALLRLGLVAHVGLVDSGQPYVLPTAYAVDGDRLLLHGSTGSRLFRALAAGAPACVTVTILDGLVLARSVFESSMNYRSAMVLGSCTVLVDAEKLTALQVLTEHLMPGRWTEARHPSPKELAATVMLAMPLTECSVKISAGDPSDLAEDLDRPVWAGVVPVEHRWGAPVTTADMRFDLPPPAYLGDWPAGRS